MIRFFLLILLLNFSQQSMAQQLVLTNNVQKTTYAKSLVFSTFNAYTLSKTISAILEKAYQKLGISISIKYLPGNRALYSSSTGAVDGELFRIAGIEKKYPELLRVIEPILELKTMAYTKNVKFTVQNWQSLAPYKLGFLRSFRKAELKTEGMDTYQDDHLSNLFKLLDKGRIDLVIESQLGASVILQQNSFPNVTALSPPVDRFKIYHYLHTKNKRLLAPLSAILLKMRQSGEIQKIISTTLQKIALTTARNNS